jgi:hypothetical protein
MISVLLEITKRNIGSSEPNFCRTTIVFSTSKQRELDLSNLNQQCLKSMPIQLSSEIESHYVSKLRTKVYLRVNQFEFKMVKLNLV